MAEKTLEERIEAAIVDRFFEPSWLHQPQQVVSSTGQVHMETLAVQIPAPMTTVARAIYDQARTEIIQKVIDRMDIDAIVSQWADVIAKDVVAQLQKTPDRWNAHASKSERQKMLEKVYDAVADEFGRQAVEHIKNTGGLLGVLEARSES